MPLYFYVILPPALLAAAVFWVAGGLWVESRVRWTDSLIRQGVAFVAWMLWMLGFIAGIGLFVGSLVALFAKLFVPGA